MLDQLEQSHLAWNASRYDWMRAAPDREATLIAWSLWILISSVAAIAGLIILIGILSSSVARRNTFNQYIIALVLPDVFFSVSCLVTCVLNSLTSSYFGGAAWCSWQSFYVVFGFSGSIWMQVVIASEIRAMVHAVHNERFYTQPPLRKVLAQVAGVYALSAFWASWIFIPSLPIAENAIGGLACLPLAYSAESEMFLWTVFLLPLLFVPLAIVGGFVLASRSMHASLDEKTLALLSFFSAILAVLLFMWLPTFGLIWLVEPRGLGLWVTIIGGGWSHLQGFVSATLYLRKQDVRQAVAELPALRCVVRPWLRLAHRVPAARRLADCIDWSLLPGAVARRMSTQRLAGVSDWAAVAAVENNSFAFEVVEYPEAKLVLEPGSDSDVDPDVSNKATIEADISRLLGHDGECAAFEFVFVENVAPSFVLTPAWFFGGLGPAFGHAAIAISRPDGTRRLINIVGGREAAGGREMVEFWEKPYDYLYGCQGKGGVFARSMCIVRVPVWDARGIEAIELYLSAMLASHRAARARWHNFAFVITLCSWLGPSEWRLSPSGNCSEWLSRGCFLAGLVRRPHIFPKAALVDLVEQLILEEPSDAPRAEIVYLKQEEEARKARTWQRRTVWRSWVAPLHLLRNLIYWDLEPFADAVVQVHRTEEGELRARVEPGRRRRPRWVRWLVRTRLIHSPLITAACAGWVLLGWPREDTPALSALLARISMAVALIIVNGILY